MADENIFGFSTAPSTGADFTPIIKYDARSGRMIRVDRVDHGNGFETDLIDITQNFKAVFDFENAETGWAKFMQNTAPSFALVPIGQERPPRPSLEHKEAIRVLLKLNKNCGGERQVREMALQAKSSLSGMEEIFREYRREKAKYPGQLPVISLKDTTPIVTNTGRVKTTNYKPNFRIDGWADRPADLVHIPATAGNGGGAQPQQPQSAPSTGSTAMPPPKAAPQADDNDFG